MVWFWAWLLLPRCFEERRAINLYQFYKLLPIRMKGAQIAQSGQIAEMMVEML
jgi:hypothetical protein